MAHISVKSTCVAVLDQEKPVLWSGESQFEIFGSYCRAFVKCREGRMGKLGLCHCL